MDDKSTSRPWCLRERPAHGAGAAGAALQPKAAGLRLQAVQLDLEDADSGYFELMGERDRLVLRQAELVGQRSADQVQRMELEMAA